MWVIPQHHNKGIRHSKFYSTVSAVMEHVLKHVLLLLLREGNVQLLFKDFSRATFDFQGPPTRNIT